MLLLKSTMHGATNTPDARFRIGHIRFGAGGPDRPGWNSRAVRPARQRLPVGDAGPVDLPPRPSGRRQRGCNRCEIAHKRLL